MHAVNLGIGQHLIAHALNYLLDEKFFVYVGPAVDTRLPIDATDDTVVFDLQLRFKSWLSVNALQCRCPRFTAASIKGRVRLSRSGPRSPAQETETKSILLAAP
jgi:hypothetical protein